MVMPAAPTAVMVMSTAPAATPAAMVVMMAAPAAVTSTTPATAPTTMVVMVATSAAPTSTPSATPGVARIDEDEARCPGLLREATLTAEAFAVDRKSVV